MLVISYIHTGTPHYPLSLYLFNTLNLILHRGKKSLHASNQRPKCQITTFSLSNAPEWSKYVQIYNFHKNTNLMKLILLYLFFVQNKTLFNPQIKICCTLRTLH